MKPTFAGILSARFDNGTAWPLPEQRSDDADTCAHELRYAGLFGDDKAPVSVRSRNHGASVIEAYEALVAMPLSQSREVLRALKAAVEMRGGYDAR